MNRCGWAALGLGQGRGALGGLGGGQAVVDVGCGVKGDAGVVMLVVVPGDEPVEEGAGIGEGAEPFGEDGAGCSAIEDEPRW